MAIKRKPAMGALRMEDVARQARVSLATVSRTLSMPAKVSPQTRRRVWRTISATGYVHNLVAGSLASKRTHVVVAIVHSIDNPVHGITLHATAEILRTSGLDLLLGQDGFSPSQEEKVIAAFLARRPDGFILHSRRHTPQAIRLLKSSGVPIVELGELTGRSLDMVVSYSNYDAAKTLTTYLIKKGYERIGFVCSGKELSECQYLRWCGYRAALREHGRPYSPSRVVETGRGYHLGAEALSTLLNRDPSIDAVFFTADVMAGGAELECLRRGWRAPERIAIAGFDDQEIAREAFPALTAIRIPREEIGRLAGQMLLDRLHGKEVTPKIVDVGFRLIDRESM
jgi:LacI family transcriptional regulator, gluconate utilization system Gnt-I transcriptional repressor